MTVPKLGKSYSWNIISSKIAQKQCDISVFRTNETGLPVAKVKYFW